MPGAAPCQCQLPGGLLITSPARTTCTPFLVADHADAVDVDQVLAAVVHVRDGTRPGPEVHGHRLQPGQVARQRLHPDLVRVIEQGAQLLGDGDVLAADGRTELVHDVAPICN